MFLFCFVASSGCWEDSKHWCAGPALTTWGGQNIIRDQSRAGASRDDGPLLQSSAANTRDTGDWGDQVSPGDRWSVQTYLAPALAAWVLATKLFYLIMSRMSSVADTQACVYFNFNDTGTIIQSSSLSRIALKSSVVSGPVTVIWFFLGSQLAKPMSRWAEDFRTKIWPNLALHIGQFLLSLKKEVHFS